MKFNKNFLTTKLKYYIKQKQPMNFEKIKE